MDEPILRRYQSAEGAESYSKKFQKHWNERLNDTFERRLVQRLLNEVSRNDRPHRALDMPCGYGRLYPLLAEASAEVVECDWSHPMLLRARESQSRMPTGGARRHVRAEAGRLPFPDRSFDLVLSVRLCHHIRSHEERLAYVRELMRVSAGWVIFTYFDTRSLKNRLRELRRLVSRKRPKWTLDRSDVEELASREGFRVVKSTPLSRFFSGHRYTLLRRE